MDIIVNLEEVEYQALVNDDRNFNKRSGYHFHVCQKEPKKTVPGNKIYLQYDNKIVGCCRVRAVMTIDDLVQTQFVGVLWRHKDKTLVTWWKTEWYEKPIECIKKIKKWKFKYFNLQKFLGSDKEPALIKGEVLCKQKKINQKEAVKILKK